MEILETLFPSMFWGLAPLSRYQLTVNENLIYTYKLSKYCRISLLLLYSGKLYLILFVKGRGPDTKELLITTSIYNFPARFAFYFLTLANTR